MEPVKHLASLPYIVALLTFGHAASGEGFAGTALNSYSAIPPVFYQARVYRQDGTLVGNVQKAEIQGGSVSRVVVGIAGNRQIGIAGAKASYDQAANTVIIGEDAWQQNAGHTDLIERLDSSR